MNVVLYKNGKQKNISVHRLVGIMFIPNPENKPEINHKDTNKLNNHISNLEWNTKKENIEHAWDNGLCKIVVGEGNLHNKPILQYDLQGNFIKDWISTAEAERELKINNSNITQCCKGKRNKAGGYMWRYKEEVDL